MFIAECNAKEHMARQISARLVLHLLIDKERKGTGSKREAILLGIGENSYLLNNIGQQTSDNVKPKLEDT